MKRLLFVGLMLASPMIVFAAPRRVVVTEVKASQALVNRYSVRVESRSTVSLSFPVSGKLAKRQVSKDQLVKKGDVLAELDSDDFIQRVAKAKSAAERAAMTLQRMRNVPKGVSQEQLSLAEADKLVADAELRIAEKALADTKIVAPFDGLVVMTSGDPGQYISAGTLVTKLHSTAINVKLNVPERLIAREGWEERLKAPGTEVEIAACPGLRLPVHFADIDLISANGTQVYGAAFNVDTPKGYNFFEGMSATLYRPQETEDGAVPLDVPSDAICRAENGEPFVWIVAKGTDGRLRVAKRTVKIIWRNFDSVAVTGDVKVGDTVVVLGCAYLREGLEVEPMKEAR